MIAKGSSLAGTDGASFTRRRLLATAGLGVAGLALRDAWLPRAAQAAPANDRLFVFAYFEGGWDVLMALDPRDPARNDPAASGIDLAWQKLPARWATMGWNGPGSGDGLVRVPNPAPGGVTRFGPAIGGMRRHHADLCVINGVNMETLTHEVGRRLFLTGRQPLGLTAQGSATASIVCAQQGPRTLVPNLSFRVESYAEGLAPFASALKVATVDDLNRALAAGRLAPSPDLQARIDAARAGGGCARRQLGDGLVRSFEAGRDAARRMTAAHLERHFDFLADASNNPRGLVPAELDEMARLRARYRIVDGQGAEAQAALAFQALRLGLAQSVSLMLADGLDHHGVEWRSEHPRRLERGFDALAVLVDDLKRTGLWERTTLLAWSEFSRTPVLNAREGRDHSLCNSALLMGAGITPGRVIGASAEGLRPLPVSLATGQVDERTGVSLSARHVLATLLAAAGLDAQHLRAGPIESALA